MKNLRKEARGRECQVRIHGICNGNNETVVLAHLNSKRLFGVGVGQKVPDIFGAWACSGCHSAYDNLNPQMDPDIEAMFIDGVFRTQNILFNEGKI